VAPVYPLKSRRIEGATSAPAFADLHVFQVLHLLDLVLVQNPRGNAELSVGLAGILAFVTLYGCRGKVYRERDVRKGTQARPDIVLSGKATIRKPNSNQQLAVVVDHLGVFEAMPGNAFRRGAIGDVVKAHRFPALLLGVRHSLLARTGLGRRPLLRHLAGRRFLAGLGRILDVLGGKLLAFFALAGFLIGLPFSWSCRGSGSSIISLLSGCRDIDAHPAECESCDKGEADGLGSGRS
jgi:hypothetical protein